MSLLEDVFLQDEANEAQELERIIEGDEFDERPRLLSNSDNNSEREDEAEEDKRRVDPTSTNTRRVIKNPRFTLNPARLTGPRGIQVIPEHFKDFKFKGKGHEKEDLDLVLKKLEHWAYRLYPKFGFEDCLKKIETLGKKRPVMVHLHKIRTDQYMSEETVVQKDSSDDEALTEEAPPEDEFDKLLQQQIELARSTPAPSSAKKGMDSAIKDNRSLIMPKATSSPSISEEQRQRILQSRKLAEERRLSRLKNSNLNINTSQKVSEVKPNTSNNANNLSTDEQSINEFNEPNRHIADDVEDRVELVKKVNRTNVIDSSDEDDSTVLINESFSVDVHKELINDKNDTNIQTNQIVGQYVELKNDKEITNEEAVILDKKADVSSNGKEVDNLEIIDRENKVTDTELAIDKDDTNIHSKILGQYEKLENGNEATNVEEIDNVSSIGKGDNLEIIVRENKLMDNDTTEVIMDVQNNKESTITRNEQEKNEDVQKEEQNRNAIPVENLSEDVRNDACDVPVESLSEELDVNVEELMDIDFSDDFE